MLFSDTYNELKFACKGNYHEKGSKFNAYAFPVHSQLDINNKLEDVKKIEKNANHYCFAFVLHPDKSSIKYNDDGEPDALAYGNMVSLCIKAIQEVSAKNDALEARIKKLEDG